MTFYTSMRFRSQEAMLISSNYDWLVVIPASEDRDSKSPEHAG